MITKKIGVKTAYITDYETIVKNFSELLSEIDQHLKLKKRGMSFLETVEKNISMQLKTYVLSLQC